MFERQNLVLSNVQARGVLQHYGIIGPTDILDLTYNINIAKWFALNKWDREAGGYRPKKFNEQQDQDKAFDECSLVYTVVVRAISTLVEQRLAAELAKLGHLTFAPLGRRVLDERGAVALPPRNLSPLWSSRAERQSGFGLSGVGPNDDDTWGSVLAIQEHAFHPTFSPAGWDRIGGTTMHFGDRSYSWSDDTSRLSEHTLPEGDECIQWVQAAFNDLQSRLYL